MAVGDEDFSGDYTDSERLGDSLERTNQKLQDSINNFATKDDEKNTAGFSKFGQKTDENGNRKWGLLKKGEQDASKKPNIGGKGGDKMASLGEKENNVKSDSNDDSTTSKFKNAVQGVKDLKSGKVGKAKGKFNKAGPLITIIALCAGIGGGSFFGQMSMPFSLISQFQESFDSISVSQNTRSKSFLKFQTGEIEDGVKDCVKAHYFKADEFRVSKRQKNKLAKNGITFEDEGGITVMKYKRPNGDIQTIVADPKHAKNGKISFDEAFAKDMEFNSDYTKGSRTWRGSVADWFDSQTTKLLERLGIKRNNWKDHKANSQDADANTREKIAGDLDNDEAGGKSKNTEYDERKVDSDGDGTTETTEKTGTTHTSDDIDNATYRASDMANDPSTGKTKLQGKLESLSKKFDTASSIMGQATNAVCGVMDFVGAVYGIVAAYQAVQIVKVASEFFEGIQKGQIDDSKSSPINSLTNSLTQPLSNSYTLDDGSKVTRERSAMEAAGISAIYGGTVTDSSDLSVKSFNMNSLMKGIAKDAAGSIGGSVVNFASSVSNSIAAFRSCNVARMAAAVVSAGSTVVKIVMCFIPPGVGCAASGALELIEQGAKLAGGIAFNTLVGIAISHLVPFIAGIFTRKAVTAVAGEDLGNMLVSGANIYMGQNHQQSGGSVANKESLIAYLQEQDRVIAEKARHERETRSPFDVTSKYTFLGSLANQMIPIASQTTSLTSIVKGMSTVVGNAVSSMTPRSSATSAAIQAQAASDQTEESCPDMAEIGGIADAFCNPYIITDTSTLSAHPATIVNQVDLADDDNLDDNGEIENDGNLARYIIYCGQRTSPWGKIDQNIAGDVQKATVGSSIVDNTISAVPIVGDVVDILNNADKEENIGYITGKACVTNNDGGDGMGRKTAKWDENKKYQRYIEDQRIAEAAGIIEQSSVSKFIAKYYEDHPLDNSFEGILARYSGMTKDKVVATLDALEVVAFMNEYEPASLYPYPQEEKEEKEYRFEEDNTAFEVYLSRTNSVVYDNRRYRNYAVQV